MADEGADHIVLLRRVRGVAGGDDFVRFADYDAHADFVGGFGGGHGLHGRGADDRADDRADVGVVADYLHEGEEGGGELVVIEEIGVGREKAELVAKSHFGKDVECETPSEASEVERLVGGGTADEGSELEDLLVDVGLEVGEVSAGVLSHVSVLSS